MLTLKMIIVLVAMATAYEAAVLDRDTQAAWDNHVRKYGLQFNSVADEAEAQSNFVAIDAKIKAHNSDIKQTYTQGHNQFSHMNQSQRDAYKGAKVPSNIAGARYTDPQLNLRTTLPASIDFRSNHCLQAVKNQGNCGSCYAFSAVSVVEFDYCIKHGSPVSLSEQQATDCSSAYGNAGCGGGWPVNVWQYVAAKGGLDTEASYPYTSGSTGISGACNYSTTNVGGMVSTSAPYAYLTPSSVTAIQTALANKGLVSVAINANNNFMAYTSGIFSADATSCVPSAINHAVTIVGYGTSGSNLYWIVRNSWSAGWGAAGYILMQAGQNTCGIESYPMTTTAA